MSQERPTKSTVYTQGSIHWALDDPCIEPYRRVKGDEYLGRVYRTGLEPTPSRSSSRTSRTSTFASQEPELVSQVNQLQARARRRCKQGIRISWFVCKRNIRICWLISKWGTRMG
jgi:hypothetical protein